MVHVQRSAMGGKAGHRRLKCFDVLLLHQQPLLQRRPFRRGVRSFVTQALHFGLQ
jgi:hypothetical protein